MGRAGSTSLAWVDIKGNPTQPPDLSSLPSPDDVLAGRAPPDFEGLRLRSQNSFICGNLHNFVPAWDRYMGKIPEYSIVRPWLVDGVDVPSFFQHYKGTFNGRHFDSVTPPKTYFQNAPICHEYKDFITKTVLKRLEEGSMLRDFSVEHKWLYISNDNIRFQDLSDDVHLNASGVAKLYRHVSRAFRPLP